MVDAHSTIDEPIQYPWYRGVTDKSLEQGDLLFDFPVVTFASSYRDIVNDNIDLDVSEYDVVVLTQSCDLTAGKVESVLLCPFFTKEELAPKFDGLGSASGEKNVQKGKWESLYLLPPCSVDDINLPPRIVNFRQIFTMPLQVTVEYVEQQQRRARLSPPYREHLAQAFARFIMRIGFPIDFRL